MLKRFEVTGFKNFAHTFSLDFSDVRDYRFNEHHIENSLLKTGIIYGKNSMGKSNLGLALFDIVSHLTGNNVSPGLYGNYLNIANEQNKIVLTSGASQVNSAKFRYVFRFGNEEIYYNYTKTSNDVLLFEQMSIGNETIIDVTYGGLPKDIRVDVINKEIFSQDLNFSFYTGGSILKFALNNTALSNEHPLFKMMDYVSKMLWFRCLDENRYIGYKTSVGDYHDFMCENDALLSEFQELMVRAGIQDKIRVIIDPDGKKRLYSGDGEFAIPFYASASSGTKALYNFFYWNKTAPDTSLMFIDEFDAYYHFELSETVVNLVSKLPNTQVLLTSHNTNLLSNRFMRPDCLFILTPEKLTSFVNATSRELREGHNLERLYMGGDFNE